MATPNPIWASFIPDGPMNESIKQWHEKQAPRTQTAASPSSMTECPRVVWLRHNKHVKPFIPLGWGKAQRLLLGRNFENMIATQLKQSGELLYHWADNFEGESVKFEMGDGDKKITGTPDLLLRLGDTVAISDAKTSTAKSFSYVPTTVDEVFKDHLWFKYKMQLEAYFMLCHKNKQWFKKNGLLLPEVCHLFSYSLDDGIVRREFTWKPTQKSIAQVLYYVTRWNRAYRSETMPDCVCEKEDQVKFCYYVTKQKTTRTGSKIGTTCCEVGNDN